MHMRDTAFLAALLYAVNPAKAQQATVGRSSAVAHRIAVAAHDLPRGTVLSAADISWTDDSAAVASGRMFTRSTTGKVSAVTPGWVTRRLIRAGEPLDEPGVSRPDLVTTGDPVDVVYRDEGIMIKLHGVAVGSGAQGDEVYVKLDTRRRLRGVIESANTIRIL